VPPIGEVVVVPPEADAAQTEDRLQRVAQGATFFFKRASDSLTQSVEPPARPFEYNAHCSPFANAARRTLGYQLPTPTCPLETRVIPSTGAPADCVRKIKLMLELPKASRAITNALPLAPSPSTAFRETWPLP
jgi:hypothetical protein